MTTEELRKRVNDLKSRHQETALALAKAERVLEEALCQKELAVYAARGIRPGDIVIAIDNDWQGNETRTKVGFDGVHYYCGSPRPALTRLKKDGTLGKSPNKGWFHRIEKLEDE